jgi:DnaK suppressor protein
MLSKEELAYFEKRLLQLKEETIQMAEASQPLAFEDDGELTSYDNHLADSATQLEERDKRIQTVDELISVHGNSSS